jgi:hypothetical protein
MTMRTKKWRELAVRLEARPGHAAVPAEGGAASVRGEKVVGRAYGKLSPQT